MDLYNCKNCPICDKEMITYSNEFSYKKREQRTRTITECSNKCFYSYVYNSKHFIEITIYGAEYSFHCKYNNFGILDPKLLKGYQIKQNLETLKDVKEKIKYWRENERYVAKILIDS